MRVYCIWLHIITQQMQPLIHFWQSYKFTNASSAWKTIANRVCTVFVFGYNVSCNKNTLRRRQHRTKMMMMMMMTFHIVFYIAECHSIKLRVILVKALELFPHSNFRAANSHHAMSMCHVYICGGWSCIDCTRPKTPRANQCQTKKVHSIYNTYFKYTIRFASA